MATDERRSDITAGTRSGGITLMSESSIVVHGEVEQSDSRLPIDVIAADVDPVRH